MAYWGVFRVIRKFFPVGCGAGRRGRRCRGNRGHYGSSCGFRRRLRGRIRAQREGAAGAGGDPCDEGEAAAAADLTGRRDAHLEGVAQGIVIRGGMFGVGGIAREGLAHADTPSAMAMRTSSPRRRDPLTMWW